MTRRNTQIGTFSGLLFISMLMLVFPWVAQAAVVISEVAWMGTDAGGANCEWVEFANDSTEAVSLTDWTLTIANGGSSAPKVLSLSGSIAPSGFYILARNTSPCLTLEPGSSAQKSDSFGSGISNTGSVLTLSQDGVAQDTADASGGWEKTLGGLNKSGEQKLTAQRSGTGWVTALPTPGAANATQSYTPPDTGSSASGSSGSHTTTANPGYVAPPLPELFADAGEDRTVVVGADTKFVASAYDRDRDVINYAKFLWNFGDGTTEEGPFVMHHFSYPGRYAVELIIKNSARVSSDRITVVAEPAAVALEELLGGGVSLRNYSGRDLDVSFWKVVQGDSEFSLPEHSVVLKDSAINISAGTLGFAATAQAQLRYPDGTIVVAPEPEPAAPVPVAAEPVPKTVTASAPGPEVDTSVAKIIAPAPQPVPAAALAGQATSTTAPVPPDTSVLAASAAASEASFPLWASATGLAGVIGLGVMSVWHARRRVGAGEETPAPAEEFTIEE